MKYQFLLDGVLLQDEPMGWDALVTTIKRQPDIKGIFATQDVILTFTGDGYRTLKAKFDTNFCDETTLTIKQQSEQDGPFRIYYEGLIFVSTCKVFIDTCTLTTEVQDNSFFARIYNNKSIEAFVEVGTSKNLVNYVGAIQDTFRNFDPCTALYNPEDRLCITVYEAFRSIIAFMTDDTVDFQSSFFEIGGEWNSSSKKLVITSGLKIGATNPDLYGPGEVLIPKFSFLTLFQEIDKNLNIGMMVDTTGTRPKIIIENNDFFYNKETIISLKNPSGIKVYVDQEKLYGTIHFGSTTTLDGTSCPAPEFPEQQSFLSFKDEQFYVLGTCNIDKELSLLRTWIVSSNVIQNIAPPLTDTSHDDEIFLIVCEEIAGVNYAKQGNPFGFIAATPRFYNTELLNSEVALRYLGGVPNSITQSLLNITDQCLIGRVGLNYPGAGTTLHISTAFTSTYGPVDYNDKTTAPFYDTNNRYTLATDRYTCGPASGGLYSFRCRQTVNVSLYIPDITLPFTQSLTKHHSAKFTFLISQFDSFGVPKATYNYSSGYIYSFAPMNPNPLIGNHLIIGDSQLIVLDPGDYIITSLIMTVDKVGVSARGDFYINILDGDFGTTFTSKGGGTLQPYDPAKYPVYNYEFSYPVSCEDFKTIKNNPHKSIEIETLNESYGCSIEQAKYNETTSVCDFILVREVRP